MALVLEAQKQIEAWMQLFVLYNAGKSLANVMSFCGQDVFLYLVFQKDLKMHTIFWGRVVYGGVNCC